MSFVATLEIKSNSLSATSTIAGTLARELIGGEVIELSGDLGSGKTTFVKGLAQGIGSLDTVQSPTFTLSRVYRGQNSQNILEIHHYDFHRLEDPGVVGEQLVESLGRTGIVTVVEWAEIVSGILPKEWLQIQIMPLGENDRHFKFIATGDRYQQLLKRLR